jgi:WD40 repeat protein
MLTRKAAGPDPCLMSLTSDNALHTCAWYHDQIRVVVAGASKNLHVWNTRTQLCEKVIEGHEDCVKCLCVTRTWIMSGGDDYQVKLWTLKTGRIKKTFK